MDRRRSGSRFGNNKDSHRFNGGRHSGGGPPPPFAKSDNFAPRRRSPSYNRVNEFAGGVDGGGSGGFHGHSDNYRPPIDDSPRYPPESSPRYPPENSSRYPPESSPRYPPENSSRYPSEYPTDYPPENSFRYPPENSSRYPKERYPRPQENAPENSSRYPQDNATEKSLQYPQENAPRYHPPGGVGKVVATPGGVGGGGVMPNNSMPSPVTGQKRGYPFADTGMPSDNLEGRSFTKIFVGSVPRTATEEDIRPMFEDHGHVLEVAFIRDKITGQQQGCCFIKYPSAVEADRAIRALHNQYTLPGGIGPIQVRYADGERERLGTVEHKLFVGGMNRHATEKEVEEIFAPYGQILDVYLMRDAMKQSRGCGFVKYSQRETAMAAINALNGVYTMRGCDQPLIVRFADPKRPRAGDSRGTFLGGPEMRPNFTAQGIRPPSSNDEPIHGHIPPNAWQQPLSPPNFGQPHNPPYQNAGNQFGPRPGDKAAPFGPVLPHSPQIPPMQKSFQSPQNLQPHVPVSVPLFQTQNNPSLIRPVGPAEVPISSGQPSFNQSMPSGPVHGSNGLPYSQPPVLQQRPPFANTQTPPVVSSSINQQQLPAQQPQAHQHNSQPPSQLAQRMSQQTQNLQASFQSSQQTFSQLQQQLQSMQPSNNQQAAQDSKQQPPNWVGVGPQSIANNPAVQKAGDHPVITSAVPAAPVKCNWTEHSSPDGFHYYYNSTTGESRWEKPEELTMFEQQQQKPSTHPQAQLQPQNPSTHQQAQLQQQNPSTHQQAQLQQQNPSTHPQAQLQPQNPSTHQQVQSQQQNPSTHQHAHLQQQNPSTHPQAQLQPQNPSTHQQVQLQQQNPSTHQQAQLQQQNPYTHQRAQLQQQPRPRKDPVNFIPSSDKFTPQQHDQSQIHFPQQSNQHSSYQVSGPRGHQNHQQELSYGPKPAAAGKVNDSGRMPQGYQQHAQDWMWKSRPTGT